MHVPKHFWNDAILTAYHLINRMSSNFPDGAFPYSILFPSSLVFLSPPRVFGCVCYIHNLGPGFANLIIVLPSVFLGYSLTHMGYRSYFQSYSSILQVLMLLLLSFGHISQEPVLQMTYELELSSSSSIPFLTPSSLPSSSIPISSTMPLPLQTPASLHVYSRHLWPTPLVPPFILPA